MRLGVDVGGTFTDLLLHDEKGRKTYQAKTPSTPEDQSIGVAAGVKLICEKAGISPSDVDIILHGTTVATNAVLEGKGARVGLLVTQGFEYTLHLAKAWTPGPLFGWINMDKPDPLASLADTRGIPERMNARGEVVTPLDEAAATKAIDDLCSSGIEALTISLMHSYANADHERRLRDIVARLRQPPRLPVLIAQHMPARFTEAFADRLRKTSGLDVREARHGDVGGVALLRGDVDRHLGKHEARGQRIQGLQRRGIAIDERVQQRGRGVGTRHVVQQRMPDALVLEADQRLA